MRHLQEPGVGLVGPVTNFAGNEARIRVGYEDIAEMNAWAVEYMQAQEANTFEIQTLTAFCVLFSRFTLQKVGLLDERFYIGMFEDDDFSRRVRQSGLRVVCCKDVFIHHFGRTSFSRLSDEEYHRVFEAHRHLYEEKWGKTS